MISVDAHHATPLAPVAPPKGARFWVGTWSGRLILVNAVVFAVLSFKAGTIGAPDTESLLAFGAKDAARLAHGEVWRLFTPMFIHIGIVHFLVNSYMLYAIGFQLERILGPRWFLAVYLAAGVAGNVASAVFTVNMSAGASGALFGLLGAGLYLERSIGNRIREVTGRRPQNRAYLATVLINLAFGFMVPFIDNAAHVGGLVAGTVLTYAMVNLRPNTLQRPRKRVGVAAIALLALVSAAGAYLGTSKDFLSDRLLKAAESTDDAQEQIVYYTQALEIRPDDAGLRLRRARLLFLGGEAKYAFYDLRIVVEKGGAQEELMGLADELSSRGFIAEAWQVRRLVEHGVSSPADP